MSRHEVAEDASGEQTKVEVILASGRDDPVSFARELHLMYNTITLGHRHLLDGLFRQDLYLPRTSLVQ